MFIFCEAENLSVHIQRSNIRVEVMERFKAFNNKLCPQKFCCIFKLEIGLKIFGVFEGLCWVLLAAVSIYSEAQYASAQDLFYLTYYLEEDWYYHVTFDDLRDSIDGSWRSKKSMATIT